jgi:hypothetical protein
MILFLPRLVHGRDCPCLSLRSSDLFPLLSQLRIHSKLSRFKLKEGYMGCFWQDHALRV